MNCIRLEQYQVKRMIYDDTYIFYPLLTNEEFSNKRAFRVLHDCQKKIDEMKKTRAISKKKEGNSNE